MELYNELADVRRRITRVEAAMKDTEMKGRDAEKGDGQWWECCNEWKRQRGALLSLRGRETTLLKEIML